MALNAQVASLYTNLINSTSVRIKRYPRTSDAAALAGVATTSGKSYTYGAWAEVIAANGITTVFWLVGAFAEANVVADIHIYQVGIGAGGAEVSIFEFPVTITQTTAVGEGYEYPVMCPFPIKVAANTRVAACSTAASANNRAAVFSVLCATGLV